MLDENESQIDAVDLPFTLYLNQRLTFDALASLEDGFSQFTTVSTTSSGTDTNEKSAEARLGSGNIFAFLGIEFGGRGGLKAGRTEIDSASATEQVIHTPASLFARLRRELFRRDMIQTVSNSEHLNDIRPGAFVEFEATLHRSPLEDFLTTIVTMLPMVMAFDPDAQNPRQSGGRSSRGKNPNALAKNKRQPSQIEVQAKALLSLLSSEGDEYKDLVAETDNIRTVITAEKKYFIDPTMNDVIDGTFRILGKATRVIPQGDQAKISLMRKATLGKFGDASTIFGNDMSKAFAESGFTGTMEDHINAPAMQVIPLAIFT